MPRTKNFTREAVFDKAIPLFLKKGYVDTSIQDLELATGVNKSGLYAEFESKENLYSACMDYFALFKSAGSTLLKKPYGWSNIYHFLSFVPEKEKKSEVGCLVIYTMRDYNSLPKAIKKQNESYLEQIRALLVKNISAEKTKTNPETIADVVMRLFAGETLLKNVTNLEQTNRAQSIEGLMIMLRGM